MDPETTTHPPIPHKPNYTTLGGAALIGFGLIILLDQYLKTGWLPLVIPLGIGLIFSAGGILTRRMALIIPGGILSGLGAGALAVLSPFLTLSLAHRISLLLFLFALGWGSIPLIAQVSFHRKAGWALLAAVFIAGLSGYLYFAPWQPLDLVFYIPVTTGAILLINGILFRKIGLIIPGCLVVTIAPGAFFSWTQQNEPNSLARTGVMLVVFALGWALITIFSRVITHQFVWWPLIPGGVLAMVGWGLYTAGNPHQALSFIGNTGSIGLIIFGVYLLLWRRGIRRQ